MSYQAPLRDMRFVLHELFDISGHCALLGNGLDRELIDGVLQEGARYTAEVVAPLNRNSADAGVQLPRDANGRIVVVPGVFRAD